VRGKRSEPKRQLASPLTEGPTAEQLMKALNHVFRRKILRILHEAGEARSASELTPLLGLTLSHVSYHLRSLYDLNVVALTEARYARGSLERFYISVIADNPAAALLLDSTKEQDEN
jgi:DNA-binding transcriptional ArsR family regulator